MKQTIMSNSSKYQIGGFSKHRPQEHLFTAKSMIALNLLQGKCAWLQLYDIEKFFDKENLRDAMATIHSLGVDPKIYRTWFISTTRSFLMDHVQAT